MEEQVGIECAVLFAIIHSFTGWEVSVLTVHVALHDNSIVKIELQCMKNFFFFQNGPSVTTYLTMYYKFTSILFVNSLNCIMEFPICIISDVVINNAGILRDKSFARTSDQDWGKFLRNSYFLLNQIKRPKKMPMISFFLWILKKYRILI